MTFKSANTYLEDSQTDLKSLLNKVRELETINAKVRALLSGSLKATCQVANIVDDRLILFTSSGSVATELHFQTPDLLKKFKTDSALAKIKTIQCKVTA